MRAPAARLLTSSSGADERAAGPQVEPPSRSRRTSRNAQSTSRTASRARRATKRRQTAPPGRRPGGSLGQDPPAHDDVRVGRGRQEARPGRAGRLQVGVGQQHPRHPRRGDPRAQRLAIAAVLGMHDEPHPRVAGGERAGDRGRVVGAAVVDDHDLVRARRSVRRPRWRSARRRPGSPPRRGRAARSSARAASPPSRATVGARRLGYGAARVAVVLGPPGTAARSCWV